MRRLIDVNDLDVVSWRELSVNVISQNWSCFLWPVLSLIGGRNSGLATKSVNTRRRDSRQIPPTTYPDFCPAFPLSVFILSFS